MELNKRASDETLPTTLRGGRWKIFFACDETLDGIWQAEGAPDALGICQG